jgi:glucose/arabinose dehydrogenase
MKKMIGIVLFILSPLVAVVLGQNGADYVLREVAGGFTRPLLLTHAGDGSGRLFVVEQNGLIKIIQNGSVLAAPFLDVSSLISRSGNEQGLLGLAFHPDYAQNGWFFINYTDTAGDTVVARYSVSSDPNVADPASAVTVLAVDQPYSNHNGGHLVFGPDGHLYIGLGDGGSGGDPQNRAQNPQTLLGKMLRINVDQLPYTIPPDNPFVDGGALPEIWALGLRNPWRYSFDRATGDLYIADVGQNAWEEVNFQPASSMGGENYGWNVYEGNESFRGGALPGAIMPVAVYGRDKGCSVSGGYVYRGPLAPGLEGVYLYGDFCSGIIWTMQRDGSGNWVSNQFMDTSHRISSFGEDEQGNVYVVDHAGRVLRLEAANQPGTPTTGATIEPTLEPTVEETTTVEPTLTETPAPTGPTLRVAVTPDTANVGDTINVTLGLEMVENVYGLQVACQVDPAVLNGVSREDGEAFNSANSFFVDLGFQPDGRWLVAASHLKPNPPISGNYWAFSLLYTVQGAGSSAVDCSAIAVDEDGRELPLAVINGGFNGAPVEPTVEPTPEPTATETPTLEPTTTETPTPEPTVETTVEPTLPVGQSTVSGVAAYQNRADNAGITVELLNTEGAPIVETVTAADGAYSLLAVPLGVHTLRLSAPQHLAVEHSVTVEVDGQEIEVASAVLPAGDVDDNGLIDTVDATIVGANYALSVPPAPPNADLNGDGLVNLTDLVLVGGNFGLTAPVSLE